MAERDKIDAEHHLETLRVMNIAASENDSAYTNKQREFLEIIHDG